MPTTHCNRRYRICGILISNNDCCTIWAIQLCCFIISLLYGSLVLHFFQLSKFFLNQLLKPRKKPLKWCVMKSAAILDVNHWHQWKKSVACQHQLKKKRSRLMLTTEKSAPSQSWHSDIMKCETINVDL